MASRLQAVAERRVEASADTVFRLIANYQDGHSRILPAALSDYGVEEGGIGAGTVHHVTMTLGGQSQTFRMGVDEPEPGRVLRETEIDGSSVTIFTVDPDGHGCHVRIETSWQPAKGLAGLVERLFARRMVRRVLEEQLVLIDQEARK
jgi:hypothetical protein